VWALNSSQISTAAHPLGGEGRLECPRVPDVVRVFHSPQRASATQTAVVTLIKRTEVITGSSLWFDESARQFTRVAVSTAVSDVR